MCRSKQDGGKRCDSHSPARRRLNRAAIRIYGGADLDQRRGIESMDPKFVYGTIAERARVGATTTDEKTLMAAMKDHNLAVRDAAMKNPITVALKKADNREKEASAAKEEAAQPDSPELGENATIIFGKDNKETRALAEKIERLRKQTVENPDADQSIEFLKDALEIAKQSVKADSRKDALTRIVQYGKNEGLPVIVDDLVARIDNIANFVSFIRKTESVLNDSKVRKTIQSELKTFGLPRTGAVFDCVYGFVRENYPQNYEDDD